MPRKADLVSPLFERWRFSDRPVPGLQSVRVFDQGEELTGGVDYAVENDSIIAMTSEAGEPLTVEVTTYEYFLKDLLTHLLVDRSNFTADQIDVRRLGSLYANSASIYARRVPLQEVVGKLLKGVGGNATLRRDGVLAFDAVVPPTAPGPRGGPCVEISSAGVAGDGSIVWETGADLLSQRSFTLGAWIKTHRFGPTDNTSYGDIMLLRLAGTNDELRLSIEVDEGVAQMELEWYRLGVLATQRRVTAPNTFGEAIGEWFFVAVVNNESFGTLSFYGAHEGESELAFLGITDDVPWENAFPVANGVASLTDVNVGYDQGLLYELFRGGIAEPQVWNVALSFTAVENAFKGTLPNTSGRAFFASLEGLSAAALVDVESSTVPTVTGDVVERPNLIVDLRRTPRPLRRRALLPAQRIDIFYDQNDPLGPAEIAPIVTAEERAAAQREWRVLPFYNPAAAPGGDAREVKFEAPWKTANGARAAMRLARYRYATARDLAILGPSPGGPPLRAGLLLEAGDEVTLIGDDPGLAEPGAVYRVVANRQALNELDCELTLWR